MKIYHGCGQSFLTHLQNSGVLLQNVDTILFDSKKNVTAWLYSTSDGLVCDRRLHQDRRWYFSVRNWMSSIHQLHEALSKDFACRRSPTVFRVLFSNGSTQTVDLQRLRYIFGIQNEPSEADLKDVYEKSIKAIQSAISPSEEIRIANSHLQTFIHIPEFGTGKRIILPRISSLPRTPSIEKRKKNDENLQTLFNSSPLNLSSHHKPSSIMSPSNISSTSNKINIKNHNKTKKNSFITSIQHPLTKPIPPEPTRLIAVQIIHTVTSQIEIVEKQEWIFDNSVGRYKLTRIPPEKHISISYSPTFELECSIPDVSSRRIVYKAFRCLLNQDGKLERHACASTNLVDRMILGGTSCLQAIESRSFGRRVKHVKFLFQLDPQSSSPEILSADELELHPFHEDPSDSPVDAIKLMVNGQTSIGNTQFLSEGQNQTKVVELIKQQSDVLLKSLVDNTEPLLSVPGPIWLQGFVEPKFEFASKRTKKVKKAEEIAAWSPTVNQIEMKKIFLQKLGGYSGNDDEVEELSTCISNGENGIMFDEDVKQNYEQQEKKLSAKVNKKIKQTKLRPISAPLPLKSPKNLTPPVLNFDDQHTSSHEGQIVSSKVKFDSYMPKNLSTNNSQAHIEETLHHHHHFSVNASSDEEFDNETKSLKSNFEDDEDLSPMLNRSLRRSQKGAMLIARSRKNRRKGSLFMDLLPPDAAQRLNEKDLGHGLAHDESNMGLKLKEMEFDVSKNNEILYEEKKIISVNRNHSSQRSLSKRSNKQSVRSEEYEKGLNSSELSDHENDFFLLDDCEDLFEGDDDNEILISHFKTKSRDIRTNTQNNSSQNFNQERLRMLQGITVNGTEVTYIDDTKKRKTNNTKVNSNSFKRSSSAPASRTLTFNTSSPIPSSFKTTEIITKLNKESSDSVLQDEHTPLSDEKFNMQSIYPSASSSLTESDNQQTSNDLWKEARISRRGRSVEVFREDQNSKAFNKFRRQFLMQSVSAQNLNGSNDLNGGYDLNGSFDPFRELTKSKGDNTEIEKTPPINSEFLRGLLQTSSSQSNSRFGGNGETELEDRSKPNLRLLPRVVLGPHPGSRGFERHNRGALVSSSFPSESILMKASIFSANLNDNFSLIGGSQQNSGELSYACNERYPLWEGDRDELTEAQNHTLHALGADELILKADLKAVKVSASAEIIDKRINDLRDILYPIGSTLEKRRELVKSAVHIGIASPDAMDELSALEDFENELLDATPSEAKLFMVDSMIREKKFRLEGRYFAEKRRMQSMKGTPHFSIPTRSISLKSQSQMTKDALAQDVKRSRLNNLAQSHAKYKDKILANEKTDTNIRSHSLNTSEIKSFSRRRLRGGCLISSDLSVLSTHSISSQNFAATNQSSTDALIALTENKARLIAEEAEKKKQILLQARTKWTGPIIENRLEALSNLGELFKFKALTETDMDRKVNAIHCKPDTASLIPFAERISSKAKEQLNARKNPKKSKNALLVAYAGKLMSLGNADSLLSPRPAVEVQSDVDVVTASIQTNEPILSTSASPVISDPSNRKANKANNSARKVTIEKQNSLPEVDIDDDEMDLHSKFLARMMNSQRKLQTNRETAAIIDKKYKDEKVALDSTLSHLLQPYGITPATRIPSLFSQTRDILKNPANSLLSDSSAMLMDNESTMSLLKAGNTLTFSQHEESTTASLNPLQKNNYNSSSYMLLNSNSSAAKIQDRSALIEMEASEFSNFSKGLDPSGRPLSLRTKFPFSSDANSSSSFLSSKNVNFNNLNGQQQHGRISVMDNVPLRYLPEVVIPPKRLAANRSVALIPINSKVRLPSHTQRLTRSSTESSSSSASTSAGMKRITKISGLTHCEGDFCSVFIAAPADLQELSPNVNSPWLQCARKVLTSQEISSIFTESKIVLDEHGIPSITGNGAQSPDLSFLFPPLINANANSSERMRSAPNLSVTSKIKSSSSLSEGEISSNNNNNNSNSSEGNSSSSSALKNTSKTNKSSPADVPSKNIKFIRKALANPSAVALCQTQAVLPSGGEVPYPWVIDARLHPLLVELLRSKNWLLNVNDEDSLIEAGWVVDFDRTAASNVNPCESLAAKFAATYYGSTCSVCPTCFVVYSQIRNVLTAVKTRNEHKAAAWRLKTQAVIKETQRVVSLQRAVDDRIRKVTESRMMDLKNACSELAPWIMEENARARQERLLKRSDTMKELQFEEILSDRNLRRILTKFLNWIMEICGGSLSGFINRFDSDQSGELTRTEVRKALKGKEGIHRLCPITRDEFYQIFNLIDVDGSGTLTPNELYTAFTNLKCALDNEKSQVKDKLNATYTDNSLNNTITKLKYNHSGSGEAIISII